MYAWVEQLNRPDKFKQVMAGLTLAWNLSELEIMELVHNNISPHDQLAISFIDDVRAEGVMYKAFGDLKQVKVVLRPQMEQFVHSYLRKADGWVRWPVLRKLLTERYGCRFALNFNVFSEDYQLCLTRIEVADRMMGIERRAMYSVPKPVSRRVEIKEAVTVAA